MAALNKDSSSPERLGIEAHWILSAAGKWTEEDEKQWKREQHRENMVSFRLKKKEQRAQLETQHRALEKQLKQKLAIQRAAAARGARLAAATWCATSPSPPRNVLSSSPVLDKAFAMLPLQQTVADLVTEKEALRHENAAIASRIHEHMQLQKMIQKEAELLSSDDEAEQRRAATSSLSSTASPPLSQQQQQHQSGTDTSSDSTTSSSTDVRGTIVTIDGGGPSFFYEPVSPQDIATTKNKYNDHFCHIPTSRYAAGTMFGWSLYRSLALDDATGTTYARAWYTKRIACPRGNARSLTRRIERDSWRVLVDATAYAQIHRQTVVSQTLQQLTDDDALVVVRNTFDPRCKLHFRYLNLVARTDESSDVSNGRVRLCQQLLITDSPANRRARAADPRVDVQWITDGGAQMSFEALDDATIEVTYDHFTYCPSARVADYLLIEWGNIVIRWEQIVHPARMLAL